MPPLLCWQWRLRHRRARTIQLQPCRQLPVGQQRQLWHCRQAAPVPTLHRRRCCCRGWGARHKRSAALLLLSVLPLRWQLLLPPDLPCWVATDSRLLWRCCGAALTYEPAAHIPKLGVFLVCVAPDLTCLPAALQVLTASGTLTQQQQLHHSHGASWQLSCLFCYRADRQS